VRYVLSLALVLAAVMIASSPAYTKPTQAAWNCAMGAKAHTFKTHKAYLKFLRAHHRVLASAKDDYCPDETGCAAAFFEGVAEGVVGGYGSAGGGGGGC
jgi:hypothetical protein